MIQKIINLKNNLELKHLPPLRPSYSGINIPIGKSILKKFFDIKNLKTFFISIDELRRLGFFIIEDKIGSKDVMYNGQMYFWKLQHKTTEQTGHQIICSEIPKVTGGKIRIRLNILENKVRIEGRGTGYYPKYSGSWFDKDTGKILEEKEE